MPFEDNVVCPGTIVISLDNKEIGIRILSARKNLGYTQKQLGNLINVSDKAVSKWERGVSHS